LRVQVWDYRKEYEQHRDDILAAVDKVFSSGRLILGESVDAFERAFAQYSSARHGVGVNSGTDALVIALRALGVGPGDEVVTVANTAVPTVSAIVTAGATPRFVDVDPETYLMDAGHLEDALTSRTKCIVPVHLYGQCVDMDPVNDFAEAHGLKVLEDCAQSTGALYKNRRCGSLSDIAAFSFYPTKNLGAYGDGGMVVVRDSGGLADRARRLRMYGMQDAYYSEEHGYNSRLDTVQAEILLRKLVHLDEWIERRRQLARNYERCLAGLGLVLPQEAVGNHHAYHLYVVRHPERDRIIEELKARDIYLNISYPFPIHTMRGYGHLGYREGDLPVTEALANEVFSLPVYPTLSDEEQDTVCLALRAILA
jgi:aminotransferase EvaB